MKANSRHLFRSSIALAASALLSASAQSKQVTDAYNFKMTLDVPRIYDNMESKGYRKYQKQTITGQMYLTYDDAAATSPTVSFSKLVNQTHKVSGEKVTYDAVITEDTFPVVNAIGSNKTGEFRIPSVSFEIEALPSYAITAPDEDNSLYVTISGKGKSAIVGNCRVIRSLSGSVAGTIGCSCRVYGHVSPTRVMGAYGPTGYVSDIAAVFGTWKATRVKKASRQ